MQRTSPSLEIIGKSKGVKVAFIARCACALAVALPSIYSNMLIKVMLKAGD